MEDISSMADGSVWATGQAAGGTAANSGAMTAPGSQPAEPLDGRTDPVPPDVSPDAYDGRELQHGEAGGARAGAWATVPRDGRA